uniref:Suf domain-containing protein n=1 Tax=Macrostomum lignano TaxID=282301 RepID=A0A1I8G4L2_9PLAT
MDRSIFSSRRSCPKSRERIVINQWDIEAWSVLIRDAQERKLEDGEKNIRRSCGPSFRCPVTIGNSTSTMRSSITITRKSNSCFSVASPKCCHIELWKLYLQYIRDTKSKQPAFKEKMGKAYDFALEKMGLDFSSYSIWVDYIQFLKNAPVQGSYAESQKITAVRKIYQRPSSLRWCGATTAASRPALNAALAKKFIEDRQRDYMNASESLRSSRLLPRASTGTGLRLRLRIILDEARQVELVEKKDNPLRTDDLSLISKRVMFAYEQCLLCLGHHPDIWYEAASFLEQASRTLIEKGFADEAASMYDRATQVLKENTFAGRGNFEKVHSIYRKLVNVVDSIDPTLPYIQYMKFARRKEGIKSARSVFKLARADPHCTYHIFAAAALMEYFCSKDPALGQRIFDLGMKRFGQVPEYVLCYTEYMSHLNEDNNTGCCLSGRSPPALCQRRRAGSSGVACRLSRELKCSAGKETALLIDRYKFMELFPCSEQELRSLGYTDLAKLSLAGLSNPALSGLATAAGIDGSFWLQQSRDVQAKRPGGGAAAAAYAKPDFSQMLPFRPRAHPRTDSHPVPGGEFPLPPAASHLVRILPPPTCFRGPFVNVDQLMEQMAQLPVPEDYVRRQYSAEDRQIDQGTAFSIEVATSGLPSGLKRRNLFPPDAHLSFMLRRRRPTADPADPT